jgi:hypothetical protein
MLYPQASSAPAVNLQSQASYLLQKYNDEAGRQWLTPVIPATQEAETRRVSVTKILILGPLGNISDPNDSSLPLSFVFFHIIFSHSV